jgi:hypothetical protein
MSDQPTPPGQPGSGTPPAQQQPGWGPPPQQSGQPPGWGQPPQQGWRPPPTFGPKKHTSRNIVLGVIAALLALLVIGLLFGEDPTIQQQTAGGGSGNEQQADEDGPVTLAAGGEGVTHDVFGSETASIAVSEPEFDKGTEFLSPSRGVFAVFTVAVVARKDNISSPEFYVLVDGEKFDREHFHPANERDLEFTSLQNGQSQTGLVAFDLPARHGELIVPGGDGKPQITWRF